ncbi:MAG: recombinase family protein [Acidobacteria bacterium]|nr:recombinase family protein [Acidobacteriota bacterium]
MSRLHCAVYARYSSDKQKPTSIDDQVRKCREFAERRGWHVLDEHIYTDEAVTGATDDRPGLQRFLAAATTPDRPFEAILIDDTSRLSRKLIDALHISEQLAFSGVRIVFVSQGFDSDSEQFDMLQTIHGMVDEMYRKDRASQTYRGLEGVALRGQHTGSKCFGYRSRPIEDPCQTDPHGRPLIVGARLMVEDTEAETVRRIFTLYASGHSLKRVARLLNAEGVVGPGGKTWCHSTVRKILLNDRYRGLVFWARTYRVRVPETGKRIKRQRPPTEWVMKEVAEQRIVSEELWDAAQRQLGRMKQIYANTGERAGLLRGRATRYLFSGLVRCGVCGANLNVLASGERRAASYGCPQAQQGACTNRLRIRRDVLEKRLLEGLQDEVLRPEAINYALAGFEKELARALARVDDGLRQLRSRKAAVEGKIRNLTRALEDQYLPSLTEGLAAQEQELDSIKKQLSAAQPDPVPFRQEEVRAFVTSRLTNLRDLLSSDVATAKTELLKHVREIRLHPEGGTYRAEGEWDLLGGANTVQAGCSAATTSSGGM